MGVIKYENRYAYDRDFIARFDEDVSKGVLSLDSFLPQPDKVKDNFLVTMNIKDGESYNCKFSNLDLFTLRNEFTEFHHTGFGKVSFFEIVKAVLHNLEKFNLSKKLNVVANKESTLITVEAVDSKHGALFLKALKDLEQLLHKNNAVYSRLYFRHKGTSSLKEYIQAFSEYMETVYQDKLELDGLDEYTDFKDMYIGELDLHFFSRFDSANTLEELIEITQMYNIDFNIFIQDIDAYFRAMHSNMFDVELSYPPLALNIS